MARVLCTLAVMATLAIPATADEIVYQGFGAVSCAKITEMYRKNPTQSARLDNCVSAWASGFMTSANLARRANGSDSRNLASMAVDDQVLAIRRWCKQHPDKLMMFAVMNLFAGFASNADAVVSEEEK